ncbi:MAG: hypothetical protein ThorAB25_16070 [Candidatus Thorarchaeota archaeon AB_25]|nr:MAG: hypothetical protein ThorAB25_16070 [Candidatus Thorarchaeota archaeon AB_25]
MAEIPMSQPDYGGPSERPLGVTIIAILQLIGSLVLIFGGYTALLVALGLGIFGFIAVILGGVLLFFGIIGFIIFWGLWTLKGWAWMLAFILNLLSVIFALLSFDIISLIIPLIIVIYLNQGEVKAAFGR